MRAAFIVIGLILASGGIVAVRDPKRMTLLPSGGKWREPVEVTVEGKTLYGWFAVAIGGGCVLVSLIRKKEPSRSNRSEMDVAPFEDRRK